MAVGDGPRNAAPGSRGVVLVVEDQPDARQTLCDVLEAVGFRSVPAGDGVEAMELLQGIRPDLITLDLRMPRMSGWEVLEALRADPGRSSIPVVIVAGRAPDEAGIRVSEVAGYFVKPFDVRALLHAVDKVLGAR